MAKLQRIIPSLWFDRQAEEAAGFYCGIFPNSRIMRRKLRKLKHCLAVPIK